MTLQEEIDLAKDIAFVDNKPEDIRWMFKGSYNECSLVFRVTNERINTKEYMDILKNKKKILSVISSGDQILNSILLGSKDIDGYDISMFPKYYLKLKMAALEELNINDFKEFFYGRHPLNKEMYNKVSKHLDNDSLTFWNTLISIDKHSKLANSDLFCTDVSSIKLAEDNNPYLEPSEYKKLRSKIKNINLRLFRDDVFELREKLPDSYDLVNLSSIVVASNIIPPTFDEQKDMFKGFKLNKNGIVLSYIFDIEYDRFFEGWDRLPSEEDYKLIDLKDKYGRKEDAILVYKKK